jgi:hypothetical protein
MVGDRLGESAEGRYARAVCTATGQCAVAIAVLNVAMLIQITKSATAATALRALSLFVPPMLPLAGWAAYFRLGGEAQSASAYAVAAALFLACTLGVTLNGLHVGSTVRQMPDNEASRNAVVALHAVVPDSAGAAPPRMRRSRRKAVSDAVKAALPALLALVVESTNPQVPLVYVFGIFAVYRATVATWFKTIVYFIALGIKISGNKAQLWLMHRMPYLQPCTADQLAFSMSSSRRCFAECSGCRCPTSSIRRRSSRLPARSSR